MKSNNWRWINSTKKSSVAAFFIFFLLSFSLLSSSMKWLWKSNNKKCQLGSTQAIQLSFTLNSMPKFEKKKGKTVIKAQTENRLNYGIVFEMNCDLVVVVWCRFISYIWNYSIIGTTFIFFFNIIKKQKNTVHIIDCNDWFK